MRNLNDTITITEHVNGDLREYALYTVYDRALPGYDGLKPSQRKAIYAAKKVAANKKVKTIALTGATMNYGYHHGDMSMNATICGLAAEYSNNVPLLKGEGSFGSRQVPEAASPRYTFVQLNKDFDKYFPDEAICPSSDDIEHPEPLFYLPLIPWALVNGVKGIATGFACSILPRDVKDVARMCIDYLATGRVKSNAVPSFPQFNGRVAERDGSWIVSGFIARQSQTMFEITELPIGYDREKYVSVLDKLEEEGTILSYTDRCSKSGFRFSVKLPRASKSLADDELLKKMKLVKKYSENITVINQNGELKVYDNIDDYVKDFCDYRLSMFKARYAYYIERDSKKRKELLERVRFCELVNDGVIVTKDKSKSEIIKQLKDNKFSADHQKKFVDLPIHALSSDAIKKCVDEIEKLDKDIEKWRTIDIKKQYIKELTAL